MRFGAPAAAVVASLIGVGIFPAFTRACLRPTVDERAVQWSTAIVEAKLVSASDPVDLPKSPTTQPSARLRKFMFEVTTTLDGGPKAGERITVDRLIGATGGTESVATTSAAAGAGSAEAPVVCCEKLTPGASGATFILLLRPLKETHLSVPIESTAPDYVLVSAIAKADQKPENADDLKRLIADVRQRESAATDEQIQQQADTLARAEDDTEADHAEQTLLDIGAKCAPIVRKTLESATGIGKTRLKRVLDQLTPPALPVERES